MAAEVNKYNGVGTWLSATDRSFLNGALSESFSDGMEDILCDVMCPKERCYIELF